ARRRPAVDAGVGHADSGARQPAGHLDLRPRDVGAGSGGAVIASLWAGGTHGQPPARVRQIAFTNQIALFASASTLPYQIYYLIHDARYYLPVLLANTLFIGVYLIALPLNRASRFDAARNVVLGNVYLHPFTVT